jgi:plastocyanin
MGRKTNAVAVAAVALVLGALAAPAAGGGFCAGYDGETLTAGKGTGVAMTRNCFAPTVLYVDPGDRVVFSNKDAEVHTVGGAAGSFGDMHREIASGGRVSFTFEAEGVYPYVCLVHPGMAGAIVVGDGVGNAGYALSSTRTTTASKANSRSRHPWSSSRRLVAIIVTG